MNFIDDSYASSAPRTSRVRSRVSLRKPVDNSSNSQSEVKLETKSEEVEVTVKPESISSCDDFDGISSVEEVSNLTMEVDAASPIRPLNGSVHSESQIHEQSNILDIASGYGSDDPASLDYTDVEPYRCSPDDKPRKTIALDNTNRDLIDDDLLDDDGSSTYEFGDYSSQILDMQKASPYRADMVSPRPVLMQQVNEAGPKDRLRHSRSMSSQYDQESLHECMSFPIFRQIWLMTSCRSTIPKYDSASPSASPTPQS